MNFMKKKIVLISSLLLICGTIFANEYKPKLHVKPSVRQQGFGGFYTTDVDSFFGMYANPATLGLRREHALYPSLTLQDAGPLDDTFKIYDALMNQKIDKLGELIKKNKGLKLAMDIAPFLSFGHISQKGLGWALNTDIYAKVMIPGVAVSEIDGGLENLFTIGFGFPVIYTDNHVLSLGATGKLFSQFGTFYNGAPLSFVASMKSGSGVPLYWATGFSFDVGAFYSFYDRLQVALSFYDPFGMAFISPTTVGNFKVNFNRTEILDSRLALGLCYNIPIAWANGVITSLKVMTDYRNLFTTWKNGARNPVLELSVGTEVVFVDMFSFRFGMSEMYPSVGVGLKLAKFNVDFAMFGQELGLEPGSSPCLNASLFIGVTY